MATEPLLTLRLELEPRADPISGRLSADDGTTRPFHGWLELAAALEACLASPTDTTN